ncbi:hypothetical protein CWS02_11830 [Enterobacter sp. EA-1]|nr:hypothetical protein CWS02_11830 [Enterobacter sp. EA-1]
MCRKLAFDLSAVTSLAEIRARTLSMLAQLTAAILSPMRSTVRNWHRLDGMGLTMAVSRNA